MIATIALCLSILPPHCAESPDTTKLKEHQLNEVVVEGNYLQERNTQSPQLGAFFLSGEQMRKTSTMLGEPDLIKSLQGLPGVSGGVEGLSGLYVRGGENDENLFVLDHLPLYNVTHLGGFLSSFNPWIVRSLSFYKSSFPLRYGGRLSSITDINLESGNFHKFHGQVSIGLLAGSIAVTGPLIKDKLAMTAAVRRSWLDVVSVPALAIINHSKKEEGEKTIGRYAFGDVNLKLDYRPATGLSGFTQFYLGHDFLKIGEEDFSPNPDDNDRTYNISKLKWGNWGVNSYLGKQWGEWTHMTINAYLTHYSSNYRQDYDEYRYLKAHETHDFVRKRNTNGVTDIGAEALLDYRLGAWINMQTGVEYIHHSYSPESLDIQSNKDGFEGYTQPGTGDVTAKEFSVWDMADMSIGECLKSEMGIRMTGYSTDGHTSFVVEPRISLRWSLSSDYSLKIGYSRMHQYSQQVTNSYISLPTDGWYPTTSKRKPAQCDQLSAGLFGSIRTGLYFSAEVYYKWMDHLLEYKEGENALTQSASWDEKLTAGRGYAYGLDLAIHKTYGRCRGAASYSLIWNRRKFRELNDGNTFPAKYDNRHKINITVSYQLRRHVEIDAGWSYFTGNRMTLALYNYHGTHGSGIDDDIAPSGINENKWGLDYYGSRNNVRMPAYHRLDVGLHITKVLKGGRTAQWNFGIYNLYCRMNPLAITKKATETNDDELQWNSSFKTLSIFPIIPSLSYTYSF